MKILKHRKKEYMLFGDVIKKQFRQIITAMSDAAIVISKLE